MPGTSPGMTVQRQMRQPEWMAAMPPVRLRKVTRANPARLII